MSVATPPKVLNFIWRVALDILSTRTRLESQLVGMDYSCICVICQNLVFICAADCSVVQGVWSASGFQWICQLEGSSFKHWWMGIIEKCSLSELSHIACLCYYILDGRNRLIFQKETFS